jgi:hypothetical protein
MRYALLSPTFAIKAFSGVTNAATQVVPMPKFLKSSLALVYITELAAETDDMRSLRTSSSLRVSL